MEHGSTASHRVTITGQGRIPLSRRVREQAGFEAGDQLLMTVRDNGGILLETPTQKLRRVQNTVRQSWQGAGDVIGELVDERRAEAAHDAADDDADSGAA